MTHRAISMDVPAPFAPSRTETALAEDAVRRGIAGPLEFRTALTVQEERRAGLFDILVEQGVLDPPARERLEAALEDRRAEARERRFSRVLVASGAASPDRVERLLAEYRRAAASGLVRHFDDHLVTRGVLDRAARDRILVAHLKAEFEPEDDLYARTALAAGFVSGISVDAARARQEEAVASSRAPLPLASILVALGAISISRSERVLRAVRRHRITGDPIRLVRAAR